MIARKPVEHFFRLLPALVVPPVVMLVLAVTLAIVSPPPYEARGTLWDTERGTTGTNGPIDPSAGFDSTLQSPSQRQADALNQLISTDSIALSIALRSGLLDGSSEVALKSDPDPLEREVAAMKYVRKSVVARSDGTNLVGVTATDPNPGRALAICEATIALYLERISSEASQKTQLAVSAYQQRIEGAHVALDDVSRELTAYVAAHPSVASAAPAPYDPAFQRLQARFETQNALVTDLQRQLTIAQLDAATAEESERGRYTLIDAPSLPHRRVTESLLARTLPFGAALGLGLLLSVALVYSASALDRTIRASKDVTDLGAPVLALVPELDSRREESGGGRHPAVSDQTLARRLAARSHVRVAIGEGGTAEIALGGRQHEQFRETIRDIQRLAGIERRASIPPEEATPFVVGVTSPGVEDGKTTLAMALANSLAYDFQGGATLVDADFETHSLGAAFGLGSVAGLAEVLAGEAAPCDVVHSLPEQTLRVVSAGNAVGSSMRGIRSGATAQRVRDLGTGSSFIVIDLSAALRSTSAPLLARQCDAVVVVARHGGTTRHELALTLDRLRESNVVGVVLNHWSTHIPPFVERELELAR